jgi:Actinobacteria/chloroflexi VLRF1 release factor
MRRRVVKNVAGSGGKWLDVAPERFARWVASFAVRHGPGQAEAAAGAESGPGSEPALTVVTAADHVTFTALDGAVARCHPPFPESLPALAAAGPPAGGAGITAITGTIAAHAMAERTVGVLLVRLGGYAVGVFNGYPPVLADAKVGSRPVHGRSAAGGWSQHRFARRREKQANEALQAAAEAALMIFGRGPRLDAVILGGDKRAVAELRDEARLAPSLALATDRFLTVPDPRRAVLLGTPKLFLAVRIWLTEPGP